MTKKNDLNCTEFAINAINQQTRQCKKKLFEMWNDKKGHIIKKVWLFQEKKRVSMKRIVYNETDGSGEKKRY